MEAAQLQLNLQSKHEAGQRYVDAGNCFKKTDVEGLNNISQTFLCLMSDISNMSFMQWNCHFSDP